MVESQERRPLALGVGKRCVLAALLAGTVGVPSAAKVAFYGKTISNDQDGAEHAPHPSSPLVRDMVMKKSFNARMRLSFLVGLEGSGHHYFKKVRHKIFDDNEDLHRDATDCLTVWPYWISKSMDKTVRSYEQGLDKARTDMQNLAAQSANVSVPGHVATLCDEESYPSGTGPKKVVSYVDLRMLAELAEAEGVDLRIIYLKRSAKDILLADTVHRSFHKLLGPDYADAPEEQQFMQYVRILFTDTGVVDSFLGEIDPAFIVCHDYSHAGEPEEASKVAEFVSPNPYFADLFNAALLDTWEQHPPSNETLLFPGADVLTARLQRKLDSFEVAYCP